MWFAALGDYRSNEWFVNLMVRLLQGSPEVSGLFERTPFGATPPRYVRALLYEYSFTSFAERRTTGDWWKRELRGLYFPAISLESVQPDWDMSHCMHRDESRCGRQECLHY
jgi:hypothetical protein